MVVGLRVEKFEGGEEPATVGVLVLRFNEALVIQL